MRTSASTLLTALVGVAVLTGPLVRPRETMASDPDRRQAVLNTPSPPTPRILDHSTARVFVRTAANELTVQNRDGSGIAVLYRGPDQSQIRWVRASPSGGLLAVEEFLSGEDRPGKRRVHLVEDPGGAVRWTIPDVVEFVWSPDGQSIAYTTGTYEGLERPASTGVWTLSIPSGTAQRVNVDGDYLFWARFDRALYIRDWRAQDRTTVVLRYDPVSGTLTETSHRSIYFSSSGRYYHNFGAVYQGPFDVIVTADDRSLKARSAVLSGLTSMREPLGWAPEGDLLLIPILDERFNESALIYDPAMDSGTVVAGAGLIGWSAHAGELAYWQDGRVVDKRVADVIVK